MMFSTSKLKFVPSVLWMNSVSLNSIDITLQASKSSPVVNPAFVLENWSAGNLSLELDGKPINNSKNFRYGVEYNVEGNPVIVVWIKYQSEKPVKIVLKSIN